ncbi:carbohydrate diacid regulator [Clostridium homopropionicum DSM 5847]|uniref:Carbohydrate diacid regulator n=1 Tax=Clostridium homopropionicum DSM 5847 TaxID=1121318 RepID=A0A0L6ZEQ7_9CLOT|nr:sugar diacid recognition domain-containing protein [Clostridium homopropionicum]KOA21437.1 carbohydrate diacid regulator [Clostridium homopropionicum DSM 5847]SFG09903.1 transcriptional regulator, CdaR family [Clostridium homopropionicum]
MIILTNQLAQNIVDKMMNVIPYNVNIMNNEGIIIGSGDKNRIGQLHQGAVKAIIEDRLIAIHEISGGAKPGVNMPIYLNNNIMGVIGISGDPMIVEAFASIVKVTAELLINQEYAFNEKRVRERMKEEFLYQWTYNENSDANFIRMAEVLHIDLNLKRTAVIINSNGKDIKDKLNKFLHVDEYILRINLNKVLIIMKSNINLQKRILNIYDTLENVSKIGVGSDEDILSKSVQQALRAIEIVEKLGIDRAICNYGDLAFIDSITNTLDKEKFYSLINKLKDEGKGLDLIDTLIAYIIHNGETTTVANELHIHRNSLNYRLNKIKNITGKNPRNLVDLLEIFSACILYKLN